MISENGIAMEEVVVMVIVVMVVAGGDVQLFMTHLDFWRSQHSPEPPGNQNFYQSLQILHFQRFLAPT